jgi:hypothetical protein
MYNLSGKFLVLTACPTDERNVYLASGSTKNIYTFYQYFKSKVSKKKILISYVLFGPEYHNTI